ncbi:MAG TPA: N-acetylneuraminate lyase [Clostridiaceae bacterium]|nr:N-acetylneuraminate lyase [Clostridiaceae bacterium]
MKNLKGVFCALLTPFTKENKINDKALKELVKMNMDKGVNGFYVGGSTSEAFLMSLEERKHILEVVSEEVGGKCAIIAHIGCINTDQAIELAKHAEKVGVDAISSIAPFYYGFSFDEIKNYYFDIVNSVSVPMIIYNFPKNSGFSLNSENIKAFVDDPRFIGIKHTSSDFFSLERFKHLKRNMIVFNGYDQMFLAGLIMGADGGIGSTYNFMAEKFIAIKRLFDQGKIKEAQEIQTQVNDIIKILGKVGVFQGEKEILNLMGLDFGECRPPFKKINDEGREILKKLIHDYL